MISDLFFRLRSLFRRTAVDEDLDEELRFHLEKQAAKYVQAGMTPEQAMRRARLEFGGLDQVKGDCREARGVTFIETIVQDVRYGMRVLRKSPGFTAVVVLTLGLGIGANTAIFTLVNAVLLRSLPVRDPQQLMVLQWEAHSWPHHLGTSSFGDCAHIQERSGGENSGCSLSYPMFKEVRDRKDVFTDATAFAGPAQLDLSGNGPASMARGELVSGDYFETLGVRPALGRTLQPDDERTGAAPVVVLDFAYWQRAFAGAADVMGRTIRLNNIVFTIVGVADRGFTRLTPGKSVDMWVSLAQTTPLGLHWGGNADANSWWLAVVARLRPDVSRTQAQAAVNALFVNEVLHGAKPVWDKSDDPSLMLIPAQKGLVGIRDQFGQPLALLMAAVGMVLLIACANVAGLMLARGAAREKEMAIRLAMGAARRRVVRQLMTESLLLSFVGAAMGALLAYAGATGLAAFFAENAYSPLKIDLQPNAPVLLFAIGVAVLTGIGFGLAPAFRGARADVTTELKGNSATITPSRHSGGRRFGLGSGLVVLQVALSMVVLIGAGLLLRTLDKLRNIDPGFDTRNVLLFSIEPTLAGYKDEQIPILYANLQRRLTALPGVTGSSYSSDALLDGGLWTQDVKVEGQTEKDTVESQMLAVGPEFFTTMKIPLAEGRILEASDMKSALPAAVVNRSFVQRFVGSRNPLGLHFGGDDAKDTKWQIVGVVADTKYDTLRTDDAPTAYVPLTKGGATFALRTAVPSAGLMPAVRNVVNEVDSNLPVVRMKTQSQTIDRLLFNERLVARLFGLFGALGMVLACIGLYGLLSYEVARRTQEIGIRTALGAQRRDVLLLVLRQGLMLVVCGVVAGTGAAMVATRLLQSLLFNVRPTDPVTFAVVAGLLVMVGVAACFLPARRAMAVEPMVALRCE
ncbi:MAG: ABC transporter permease [Terracidiphilus sp.]|jgi:predicted permease